MAEFSIIYGDTLNASGIMPTSREDAIAKWQFLVDHPEVNRDYGGNTCSFCMAYDDCIGCPIYLRTGSDNCDNTPFWDWYYATDERARAVFAKEMHDLLVDIRNAEVSGRSEDNNV